MLIKNRINFNLVTNWDRSGAVGRYQIFEFDSIEECEKKAEKLVAQKKKKGYVEFDSFDKENHMCFDDMKNHKNVCSKIEINTNVILK